MPMAGIPQIVMLHWQHSKNLHIPFYHRKEKQTNHVRTIRLVVLWFTSNSQGYADALLLHKVNSAYDFFIKGKRMVYINLLSTRQTTVAVCRQSDDSNNQTGSLWGFLSDEKNSEHFHAFLYSNIQHSTFHHSLKRMVPLSLQNGKRFACFPLL